MVMAVLVVVMVVIVHSVCGGGGRGGGGGGDGGGGCSGGGPHNKYRFLYPTGVVVVIQLQVNMAIKTRTIKTWF